MYVNGWFHLCTLPGAYLSFSLADTLSVCLSVCLSLSFSFRHSHTLFLYYHQVQLSLSHTSLRTSQVHIHVSFSCSLYECVCVCVHVSVRNVFIHIHSERNTYMIIQTSQESSCGKSDASVANATASPPRNTVPGAPTALARGRRRSARRQPCTTEL